MEEGLPPEHGCELLDDALEHLLDGGGVADEGGCHLEALGRDVTHAGLDVVGDPLHEVGGVLVLQCRRQTVRQTDQLRPKIIAGLSAAFVLKL